MKLLVANNLILFILWLSRGKLSFLCKVRSIIVPGYISGKNMNDSLVSLCVWLLREIESTIIFLLELTFLSHIELARISLIFT